MNQKQRKWKLFERRVITLQLSISLLMVVILLSEVASIWVGMLSNIPVALALVGVGILVWRTSITHKRIRIALLILETFVGLSALSGGMAILQGAASGFALPLAWLAGTPFSDYTIPGLVLVMVGGTALLAAATVFLQREWAVLVSMLVGPLMVGYEVVEVISLDSKLGDALPVALGLQLFYFLLGLATFGLAGLIWMREYRPQHFHLKHA